MWNYAKTLWLAVKIWSIILFNQHTVLGDILQVALPKGFYVGRWYIHIFNSYILTMFFYNIYNVYLEYRLGVFLACGIWRYTLRLLCGVKRLEPKAILLREFSVLNLDWEKLGKFKTSKWFGMAIDRQGIPWKSFFCKCAILCKCLFYRSFNWYEGQKPKMGKSQVWNGFWLAWRW